MSSSTTVTFFAPPPAVVEDDLQEKFLARELTILIMVMEDVQHYFAKMDPQAIERIQRNVCVSADSNLTEKNFTQLSASKAFKLNERLIQLKEKRAKALKTPITEIHQEYSNLMVALGHLYDLTSGSFPEVAQHVQSATLLVNEYFFNVKDAELFNTKRSQVLKTERETLPLLVAECALWHARAPIYLARCMLPAIPEILDKPTLMLQLRNHFCLATKDSTDEFVRIIRENVNKQTFTTFMDKLTLINGVGEYAQLNINELQQLGTQYAQFFYDLQTRTVSEHLTSMIYPRFGKSDHIFVMPAQQVAGMEVRNPGHYNSVGKERNQGQQQDSMYPCRLSDFHKLNHQQQAKAFMNVYAEVQSTLREKRATSGSTAITCVNYVTVQNGLKTLHIVSANVGDSKAYIYIFNKNTGEYVGGQRINRYLHRPTDKREKEYIITHGGSVSNNRLNDDLAVSRAFGDLKFGDAIRSEPDIDAYEVDLQDDKVYYLICACDGLDEDRYGVYGESEQQYGADYWNIKRYLEHILTDANRFDPTQICFNLVREVVRRGSEDNISAIVRVITTDTIADDPLFMAVFDGHSGGSTASRVSSMFATALFRQVCQMIPAPAPAPIPTSVDAAVTESTLKMGR